MFCWFFKPSISLVVFFYLLSMLSLFLSSKVLFYCFVLVVKSLCSILLIFTYSGFSWYSLVMYLVYVGGVYMLLLFVSIHKPKSLYGFNMGGFSLFLGSYFIFEVVLGSGFVFLGGNDLSFKFCSGVEGPLYLFLCVFLVLGFFLVSLISSSKESFMR